MVTKVYAPLTAQEQRQKIFVDFVKVGGNVDHLRLKYEAGLTEAQSSNIQWGFRPEKWLEDRHGTKKAKKLIARKMTLGLFPSCTQVQPAASNHHHVETTHHDRAQPSMPRQAKVDPGPGAARRWGGEIVLYYDQHGYVQPDWSAAPHQAWNGRVHRPSWIGWVCQGMPHKKCCHEFILSHVILIDSYQNMPDKVPPFSNSILLPYVIPIDAIKDPFHIDSVGMSCQETSKKSVIILHAWGVFHVLILPCLFHQAGGVLDPNAQLKLSDFTGKGGCDKLAAAMGSSGGKAPKTPKGGRQTGNAVEARGLVFCFDHEVVYHLAPITVMSLVDSHAGYTADPIAESTDPGQQGAEGCKWVPDPWHVLNMVQMCGIQLVERILDPNYPTAHLPAHLHALRNGAFKLKPIKMSADLIMQLNAVAVKLEGCATILQDLIAKKKNKTKHYISVIAEASKSSPNSVRSKWPQMISNGCLHPMFANVKPCMPCYHVYLCRWSSSPRWPEKDWSLARLWSGLATRQRTLRPRPLRRRRPHQRFPPRSLQRHNMCTWAGDMI